MIQFENENTNLDFKAIPYKKEKYADMLKDFIAMANADTKDDRFIIMGVKHMPDSERQILGVDEFTDEASFQQIINDNIEPELRFEYSVIEFDSKKLSYFRIHSCDNPPYMLKKRLWRIEKVREFC